MYYSFYFVKVLCVSQSVMETFLTRINFFKHPYNQGVM